MTIRERLIQFYAVINSFAASFDETEGDRLHRRLAALEAELALMKGKDVLF